MDSSPIFLQMLLLFIQCGYPKHSSVKVGISLVRKERGQNHSKKVGLATAYPQVCWTYQPPWYSETAAVGGVETNSFVFYWEEKVAIGLVKQPNNKVCEN